MVRPTPGQGQGKGLTVTRAAPPGHQQGTRADPALGPPVLKENKSLVIPTFKAHISATTVNKLKRTKVSLRED